MIQGQGHRSSLQSTKSLSKFKMEGTHKAQLIIPILRSKDQGNRYSITTNVANYSSNKEGNSKEDSYIRRIKYLEGQLKKRLMDDNVLRNLFKIKAPTQMTHLDIYLEIRKLQEAIRDQMETQMSLKEKIRQLQGSLQGQEEQHIEYIEMLGESIEEKQMEWRAEKHQLEETIRQLQERYQNNIFLLDEIRKKYGQLNQKYKDLNDELQMEKSANNLQILRSNEQNQAEFNQYQAEVQSKNNTIRNLQKIIDQLRCQQEKGLQQRYKQTAYLQQIMDQRQKLQLRINEMEQTCSDYAKQMKAQRHINQQLQKVQRQSQIKEQAHTRKLQQQLIMYQQRDKEYLNMKNQMKAYTEALEQNLKVSQEIKDQLQKDIIGYLEKQKGFEKELANLEKKNVKLSIQLMQVRCEKDEQLKLLTKQRIQLEDKQNIIRNFQSKRSHSKNGSDLKCEISRKYFRS